VETATSSFVPMNPSLIRQLWALVETTQATHLVNLDDANLVQSLLRQVNTQQPLNSEENSLLSTYVYSRLALIRDLAYERLA
jgi:polynucleotide 5'-kinase involved in rRNA processing